MGTDQPFSTQKCLGQIGRINRERKDQKQLDEYTHKNKPWLRKNRAVICSDEASQEENNRTEPVNPKICTPCSLSVVYLGDRCSKKQLMAFQEAESEFHYTYLRTAGGRKKCYVAETRVSEFLVVESFLQARINAKNCTCRADEYRSSVARSLSLHHAVSNHSSSLDNFEKPLVSEKLENLLYLCL